ncbi:hypothetical protein [Cupriavidus oxalaticus]|uniref:Uncharacterized protein n=1 Tax=Cupriavidus oxalaticus TaxID=96344 RepID=A0A5P3VTC6_9BURK|nr:hypothetical protein [Cupriavidus oxalaticus]QEZ48793.1 hypothetical protein D2917_31445 [Cupriavidus oxalaticus]
MSYGSSEAFQDGQDEYRENCANLIAQDAAKLVAAHDMSRPEAIKQVTEWLRREGEATGDVTGVAAIENKFPFPSKPVPQGQVAAIAVELLDAARDAADTL